MLNANEWKCSALRPKHIFMKCSPGSLLKTPVSFFPWVTFFWRGGWWGDLGHVLILTLKITYYYYLYYFSKQLSKAISSHIFFSKSPLSTPLGWAVISLSTTLNQKTNHGAISSKILKKSFFKKNMSYLPMYPHCFMCVTISCSK